MFFEYLWGIVGRVFFSRVGCVGGAPQHAILIVFASFSVSISQRVVTLDPQSDSPLSATQISTNQRAPSPLTLFPRETLSMRTFWTWLSKLQMPARKMENLKKWLTFYKALSEPQKKNLKGKRRKLRYWIFHNFNIQCRRLNWAKIEQSVYMKEIIFLEVFLKVSRRFGSKKPDNLFLRRIEACLCLW